MPIKSIRIQNFKGFKDARIDLKPLTVILGPNSAGKSCFGQALVALSKSNTRDNILNLTFPQGSSVEFGGYLDLVHAGGEGQPVKIELGVSSGTVNLGFGAGNAKAGMSELSLAFLEAGENLEITTTTTSQEVIGSVQTIPGVLGPAVFGAPRRAVTFDRENAMTWRVANEVMKKYEFYFDGVDIVRILKLTGTAVDQNTVVPITIFQDLKSLLEKVSYLRPDRLAPLRENRATPSSTGPEIDDWGGGTDWFIHKNEEDKVKTFWFPQTEPDSRIDESVISELQKQKVGKESLKVALSKWLARLGLADSLETRVIDGGRAIQTMATLSGQNRARPLTDIGFGVSQVLPIIVSGLTLEDNGLLVVEQPEAQLHPKPQEGLADFFCSMIKCQKNVLVETHSEYLFHQLRLRAAMDNELADKIAVYFIDEPESGTCCSPVLISLLEGNELKWPKGFLPNGISAELAIRDARKARRSMRV
jgi:AAA ATPase domain